MFDLIDDPGEINNLWDKTEKAELKSDLMLKLLLAEIEKEENVAGNALELPHKSPDMYVKTQSGDGFEITVDPAGKGCFLFNKKDDPDRKLNLWNDPCSRPERDRLTLSLLFERMAREPLWMPRVAGA